MKRELGEFLLGSHQETQSHEPLHLHRVRRQRRDVGLGTSGDPYWRGEANECTCDPSDRHEPDYAFHHFQPISVADMTDCVRTVGCRS